MRRRLDAAGAERAWQREQVDTFFRVPRGWLKLRRDGVAAELIAYERSSATSGARPSDYTRVPVADVDAMHRALERSLGLRGTVRKTRELWLLRHTRIHLDAVAGLGSFLELETVAAAIPLAAAEAEAGDVIRRLALDPTTFIPVPYLLLLEQRAAETGGD